MHPRGYGVSRDADPYTGDAARDALGHGDPCPTALDVVGVPGLDHALVYAFKDDNQGPPTATEVMRVLDCTRRLLPGAKLIGSTFDAFVSNLTATPAAMKGLPVLEQEIGDTWIFGAQADPLKSVFPFRTPLPFAPATGERTTLLLPRGRTQPLGLNPSSFLRSVVMAAKQMRLAMQQRSQCVESGWCNESSPCLANFTRMLLKVNGSDSGGSGVRTR